MSEHGVIDALACWLAAHGDKGPQDAVKATAKRLKLPVGRVLAAACIEGGCDPEKWMERRVASLVRDELAVRLAGRTVAVPGGMDAVAEFRFRLSLDWPARLALGITGDADLSREVSRSIVARCNSSPLAAAMFARARDASRWEDGRVVVAPSVVAVPDAKLAQGFRRMADN